jgi:Spy/CpxP family protein refolding chaperone
MHSSARFLAAAALAVACALPAVAFAQTAPAPAAPLASPAPGTHRHHHGHRGGYMRVLNTLGLSDGQKQQIQSVVQQSRQANQTADPATRKANRAKLRAQIDAILTPDQRTRLQAALAQQRAQRRTMQGPGAPAPGATH